MKIRPGCGFLLATWLIATASSSGSLAAENCPQDVQRSAREQEALQLGQEVLRLRQALDKPEAPESLQAVLALGHQQPAYVMVRGWLSYQLQAELSLLASDQGNQRLQQRVAFLQLAIRRLDLE